MPPPPLVAALSGTFLADVAVVSVKFVAAGVLLELEPDGGGDFSLGEAGEYCMIGSTDAAPLDERFLLAEVKRLLTATPAALG